TPERLINLERGDWRGSFVDRVTLWGDGQVHVQRAPAEVLEAALSPDVGPAQLQRLLQARREQPALTLDRALDVLELTHQQRQRMRQRLTVESRCFSLWIIRHDRDRRWHHLSVLEQGQG